MLICKTCNIEYAEGKKFCRLCGTPLVPKEKPSIKLEDKFLGKEKGTKTPLICPKCKILYESGKYCRKCGSALILQHQTEQDIIITQSQAQESIQMTSSKKPLRKEELICPNCHTVYETGKFCKKCGSPFTDKSKVMAGEMVSKLPPPEPQKPLWREPREKESQKVEEAKILEKRVNTRKILIEKQKPNFSSLYIVVACAILGIMVLGYFLWPKYSHLIIKKPPLSTEVPQKGETSSPPQVVAPTKPESLTSQQSEAQVIDEIKNLLENIRQANFQKNIDLFMSCYSLDFRDREERKRNTLETWKNFDYLELSYDLKSPSISRNIATAKVEWFILISPKSGGGGQESKVVLDVTFIKEDSGWKIKEIRPIS
jgi:hypothetical protein